MKCPKCGFNSFDYLENCKKCGADLQDHKTRFGLRSLLFPGLAAPTAAATSAALVESDETENLAAAAEGGDFGFDFMSDSESPVTDSDSSADESFEFAADDQDKPSEAAAVSDDDAFSFAEVDESPAAEDLDDTVSLAEEVVGKTAEIDEDDAFSFAEEADGSLADADDDEAIDLEDWDESAEEDEAKPPKTAEEPSDPFDFRGFDAADRAPEHTKQEETEESFLASPEAGAFVFNRPEEQRPVESATHPEPDDVAPGRFSDFSLGTTPESTEAEPRIGFAENYSEEPASEPVIDDDWTIGLDDPVIADVAMLPSAVISARVVAAVVDAVVLATVFLLFLIAGELTSGNPDGFLLPSIDTLIELAIPYFLVLFALCFGYFTLFHFLTGQTPGKMLFSLRVESLYGTPVSFSQAFLRSIGGLLSILCCGLGYLVIFFNHSGRGWNDQLAGTSLGSLLSEVDSEEFEGDDLTPA